MVTDSQVRLLMRKIRTERTLSSAAAKAGMDDKTARKYRFAGKLPSELVVPHIWRTRPDPFRDVWGDLKSKLLLNPGLEAKTLFDYLQREHPGRFSDGQLRTLQRRVKVWRALEGPSQETYFPQQHIPGKLSQSDFTSMDSLCITIQGQLFRHLLYHFVLTYSNWEAGTVCFSESFESLSTGLQNALWELGGVPRQHQTDRLGAAVKATGKRGEFQQRYAGLLSHYKLHGKMTQANSPHENGDIEQRHHRFKRALDQALQLRGSREFNSRSGYEAFLRKLFDQLNSGRQERLQGELKMLGQLPIQRLDTGKRLKVKVGPSSTIRVNHNVYSVPSRLIGEQINIVLRAEYLEVRYGQRLVEKIPRLRGESRHRIQYRHIIDWLVRKPGAFANYRYRHDLFPTHRFRMTYDALQSVTPGRADKSYLKILYLAARQSETLVDNVLEWLLSGNHPITPETVELQLSMAIKSDSIVPDVVVKDVDLSEYDSCLTQSGGSQWS